MCSSCKDLGASSVSIQHVTGCSREAEQERRGDWGEGWGEITCWSRKSTKKKKDKFAPYETDFWDDTESGKWGAFSNFQDCVTKSSQYSEYSAKKKEKPRDRNKSNCLVLLNDRRPERPAEPKLSIAQLYVPPYFSPRYKTTFFLYEKLWLLSNNISRFSLPLMERP